MRETRTTVTRGHKRWALGLILCMLFTGVASAAEAADPGPLTGAGYVFDSSDVLTPSEESALNAHLKELAAKTQTELFVVYVDNFTNPSDAEKWATDTAKLNNLGPNQYLLAIATKGRSAYLSADSKGKLSNSAVEKAENTALAALKTNDWAGAPAKAADSITDSQKPNNSVTWVLFAIVGIVAIVLVAMFLNRRKKQQQVEHAHQQSLAELERAAGSALVQTDDAIKTSIDELGFAKAQFGDEVTAEYANVIANAKKNLDTAFSIKQQLDDDIPDTDEQKVEWNSQIVALLTEANTWLDEKAAKFDELRQLEQNAPQALVAVTNLHAERASAQPASEKAAAALGATYAASALTSIANNVEESRRLLHFAEDQIAQAGQSIAAGNTAHAAVAIRAAETSVTQTAQLQKAIENLSVELREAVKRAAALIAELEQDIATATGLPDGDGRVGQVVASTRAQIAAARTFLDATPADPLTAVHTLDAANTAIDSVVANVRDALARAERAKRQLSDALMNAQAKVSAAEDFINTRRGAIGATARTRIAEAGVSLNRARELETADPERALDEARRAIQLAEAAMNAAQNDVGTFDRSGFGGGNQGGGNDLFSAVLGGVIINSILGGSNRGGSNRGGGFFGGGSSGGSFNPGSFGGGGTRSRRGGGRF